MNNTSKQKNILILGSNSDIALDLLAKLEILNHNLILHYNKNNNLIYKNKKFIKNIFIKADLQKTHEVKRMFQTIKKKFSHLDIIICNFSTYDNSKKINQLKNYKNVYNINVFGNIDIILSYVKFFKKKKKIIIISSNSSLRGSPSMPAYASSKASLDNLVKSFGMIYESANLSISSMRFSPVLTSRLIKSKGLKWINKLKNKMPSKKILTPSDTSKFILKKLFTKKNINGKNYNY